MALCENDRIGIIYKIEGNVHLMIYWIKEMTG